MGGGLWDYDIDADTLTCNDRWYAIMGLDPGTTPIRKIADFQSHIHPDDVSHATVVDPAQINDLMARGSPYRVEFRIIRPDGSEVPVRSVASLVIDSRSHHVRALGCMTDMKEFLAGGILSGPIESWNAAGLFSEEPEKSPLSGKERDCLFWLSLGKTAWETATIAGRSQRTIEFHLNNAVRKLDASNKVHAAAIAIRKGLI